jgi:hypothetical protein
MKTNRNIIVSLCLFAICFCGSQVSFSQSKPSSKALQNIAADKVLLKAFESGDVSKLDQIIDPVFVNHQAGGDIHGLDSLKIGINRFHTMMGTVNLELIRQWADEEFVNDWVRFSSPFPAKHNSRFYRVYPSLKKW